MSWFGASEKRTMESSSPSPPSGKCHTPLPEPARPTLRLYPPRALVAGRGGGGGDAHALRRPKEALAAAGAAAAAPLVWCSSSSSSSTGAHARVRPVHCVALAPSGEFLTLGTFVAYI